MRILNNIRKLRRDKDLSQQQIADFTGAHVQQISYLENGKYQIVQKLDVDKLSEILETPVNDIFTITT